MLKKIIHAASSPLMQRKNKEPIGRWTLCFWWGWRGSPLRLRAVCTSRCTASRRRCPGRANRPLDALHSRPSNPLIISKEHPCECSFVAEKVGFEPTHRLPQSTPLAGEPLTATWVLLHIRFLFSVFGGERGIRTPGAFQHHWFSRPAP